MRDSLGLTLLVLAFLGGLALLVVGYYVVQGIERVF